MRQIGPTAVVAGAGSQPRFEERDRASQIIARLIRNGQPHHAMRVEFPARFFNRLARTITSTQGLRCLDPSRPSAVTHSALGDTADLLDVFRILNHRLGSRGLNHASLVRHVLPNLAAYTATVLRSASSHRCNGSSSFLPSRSAHHFLLGGVLSTSPWRLSSTQAAVLY
jgi:hypothetical protein